MGGGGEILYFIFPDYTEIGDGWLKFILYFCKPLVFGE